MKKLVFFVLAIILTKISLSQSISYRSNGVVTVSDMRLQAEKNFFVPRYNDTTEANLNKGIDSCGALIFSRDVNSFYYRACNPKRWALIAAATGGNPWTLAGNSDAIAGSNFLGTTNNVPLEFRIKNVKSGLIDSTTRNTTIGFAGQRRTTTATNNASFGWRALDSVTTGSFNTAIGIAAMKDNVSGNSNTAIGYAALNQTKRAFGDVAIGFGVLARDSFGFGNVGIGYDVANSGAFPRVGIDTMQYNTIIGYRAGYNQKGGRNNVFIGKEAGRNDTTGVGNIFIGKDAGRNQIGSNKLMISNSDTSFPLIKGDFSNYTLGVNGKFGIKTETPDSVLTVNGGVRLSSLYSSNDASDSMLVIKSNGGLGYRQISSTTTGGIDSLKQSNDSVFARKNSQFVFQYKNAYDTVYTQSPIMSMVSGDSNIIFFNADTANAWRGGSSAANDTAKVVIAKVHNATGTTLQRGEVVYLSGANGDVASVKRANNKQDSTSSKTFGIVRRDIAAGDTGYITTQGQIEKLNLGAYNPGDILWLDSIDGQFTKVVPQAPYHSVFLGVVERANNGNGLMYVKPQNGYELQELHNVQVNGIENNQILVYSDTQQVWKNRSAYTVIDTTKLQQKSLPAYSIMGNNTNAAANPTAVYYKDTSGTYTGSITWTPAGSAPSGATNHTYRWTRIGNQVTITISLVYQTFGTSLTQVVIALPSDAPTPLKPTGLTAASNPIYVSTFGASQTLTSGTLGNAPRSLMRNNAANNGFEFVSNFTGSSITTCFIQCQYTAQ